MIEWERERPLLLYDGDCGFCRRSVLFLLAHERRHSLQLASLAGETGRRLKASFPALAGVDSLVWFEAHSGPGEARPLVGSDAVLAAIAYLGGPWRLLCVLRLIPRPVRETAYRWVARHRSRLAGAALHCEIPSKRHRERFLDGAA